MRIRGFLVILLSSYSFAQEVFVQKDIIKYFNEKNPFYYEKVGDIYIKEYNEIFYQGAFDIKLDARYEKKEYPLSLAEFTKAGLKQSLGNGVEFSAAYRQATGTQEYNNIKTSKDGEGIINLHLPIFNILNSISKNRKNLSLAEQKTKITRLQSQEKIIKFYLDVSKLYYKLLLQKELLQANKELLDKAYINFEFIQKSIQTGKLPQIALVEIESEIINRKQRVALTNIEFQKNFYSFLQYLNINKKDFNKSYTLPELPKQSSIELAQDKAMQIAFSNSLLLKSLHVKKKEITIKQKYNQVKKYPKLDVNLYGVYDLKYKEGYKATFDFNLPLQRSSYKGLKGVYTKEMLLIQNKIALQKSKIKTAIITVMQEIKTKKEVIRLAKKEVTLKQKVEDAQRRRYKLGIGNLLTLNQREIITLQAKQKLLNEYYKLIEKELELRYILREPL
ncbi:TolC family protein [Sulfurimonas sediminis]|uniref:TolC family protein n=1 Tax=Sulfurimonas sediminis TaxID=2590020 RepID=A0A7M1AZR7_9BACT|nr:TolC family protein [Sulfurimonas sediminis]QOP42997.1 TolC family protein [Sulfurimonas sediminis]